MLNQWIIFVIICLFLTEFDDITEVENIGQREHATALLMACRHLPAQLTSPGQRATMLTEAAKTYEKLGDKKGVQECRNLLMKHSNTTSCVTTRMAAPVPIKCSWTEYIYLFVGEAILCYADVLIGIKCYTWETQVSRTIY